MNGKAISADATRLATELFFTTLTTWNSVYTFRWMGQLGLPYAQKNADWQHKRTTAQIAHAQEYADLFKVDRKDLIAKGFFDDAAKAMTKLATETFESSLDAACLIFSRSLLDSTALEWCRVCSLVAPADFAPLVEQRKVSLSEVQQSQFDQLLRGEIDRFLETLEREALVKKLDLLFRLCKPPAGFEGMKDYRYDRERIVTLDNLRHEFVHGRAPKARLPNGESDLLFLQNTSVFLFPLVNQKYGIRIDPAGFDAQLFPNKN